MTRILEKSKRIEEAYRRKSPRISAALDDAWKAHRQRHVALTWASSCPLKMASNDNAQSQGPASRTRSRKKRKLRPVLEVVPKKVGEEEEEEEPKREDHQDQRLVQDLNGKKRHEKQDLWSTETSKPWHPEKRVLQLILDILQRRDIHEIFAEPVDPEEVEDYYEIIKEPMDFGTMRAKLHEGMYKDLKQFEHDVFLITKNAMHFNSSATIYFRQARAINELATKVFHALKTRPESFELEFLESRRRRPRGEAGNSLHRTCLRTARDMQPIGAVIDESAFKTCPLNSSSSNVRKRTATTYRRSRSTSCLEAEYHEVPCDGGDDKGSRSIEADRRGIYKPWTSLLDEDESIISAMSSSKKQLEHVIQQDISYRESIMLFVKDLGPVVQTMARRKLLGSFPPQNCQIFTTTSNSHWDQFHGHPTLRTNASERMDLKDSDKAEETCVYGKMATHTAGVSDEFCSEGKNSNGATWWSVRNRSDKVHQNQSIDNQMFRSTTMTDQAKLHNVAPSTELGFGHHDLNSSELKLRNVDGSSFSRPEGSMTFDRCKSSMSQFLFEKARPDQANSLGQHTFLQRSLGTEVNFFNF